MSRKKKKKKKSQKNKKTSIASNSRCSGKNSYGENKLYSNILETVSSGAEPEILSASPIAVKKFDPSLVRFETRQHSAIILIERIRRNVIDLNPDFQRKAGIWSDEVQSRLIESLMINIPIPAFYIDTRDEDKWIVIDGLQRLTAVKRFVITRELKLVGLEFLQELEGKFFDEIPGKYQRRLSETSFTIFEVENKTSEELTFSIFRRINTGGLPLSTQEIRHALNQGQVIKVLNTLSETDIFEKATAKGVSDDRMGDKECVLRFIAFKLTPYYEYKTHDFDGFLNATMQKINNMSAEEVDLICHQFERSMTISFRIFKNDAFRKRYSPFSDRHRINKALFEAWSVNISNFDDKYPDFFREIFDKKEQLKTEFMVTLNRNREFDDSISQGTSDSNKVHVRFSVIKQLIEEVLNDKNS